jgi:hypothetical protein
MSGFWSSCGVSELVPCGVDALLVWLVVDMFADDVAIMLTRGIESCCRGTRSARNADLMGLTGIKCVVGLW